MSKGGTGASPTKPPPTRYATDSAHSPHEIAVKGEMRKLVAQWS
jgi:hypothetical protein